MIETRPLTQQDSRNEPHISLEALADDQGVRPIRDIQQLRANFWPDDENPEAFVRAVKDWRLEAANR